MTSSPRETLNDKHGRSIGDLRISVTDRCNFRCQYCMPDEPQSWTPRTEIASYEEIMRVVRILTEFGVGRVRLSGGEPLLRKNLDVLVRALRQTPGIEDISLTTNGYFLENQIDSLAQAGLTRVNVSLDTLRPERFQALTKRDGLARVLAGLQHANAHPLIGSVKVNAVALRDSTEEEVEDFVELAVTEGIEVRFIEFMPLDSTRSWRLESVLASEEIRELIMQGHSLTPLKSDHHATATTFEIDGGRGRVGFVSSVTAPFCGTCNRIRLTADGSLRPCLFSDFEVPLLVPMRNGATDAEIKDIVKECVWEKSRGHQIGSENFVQPKRKMSSIGG